MRAGEQGVVAVRALGDVARGAVDGHVGLACAGEQGARARRDDAGGKVRPDVEAEDAVCVVTLEHAALADDAGAAGGLLRGLEHEQDIAGQGAGGSLADASQHLVHPAGRGEGHGHVAVVAAGVHVAGLGRAELDATVLGDGQRVHVRADGRSGSARLAPACRAHVEERADAALAGRRDLAGQAVENPANVADRLWQVKGELRDAMQVSPELGEKLEVFHVAPVLGLSFPAKTIRCAAR